MSHQQREEHPTSYGSVFTGSRPQQFHSGASDKYWPDEGVQMACNDKTKSAPGSVTLSFSRSFSEESFSSYSSTSSKNERRPLKGGVRSELDWRSLVVIYVVTVVAEAARGLLLPSTWPYFAYLGGSKGMLGVLIASYSFGRMLSTTPLGYLSDHFSSSTVMCGASALQAVGHLLYAVAPSVNMLYFSRILVGFGSATTSVARAHIAKAIPLDMRTHHFAYLSGLQFFGFAVLPVFGGLMSLIPETNVWIVPLNGFTYPAILLVFANLLCIDLILRFYNEPPESQPGSPMSVNTPDASGDESATIPPSPVLSSGPDVFALVICLVVNLVFRGVLAELETVTIPFFMEEFDITYGMASVFMSVIGCMGIVMYFSFKPIASRFSDRILVVSGLFFIAFGCIPLSIHPLVAKMNLAAYTLLMAFTWSFAYPIGQTAILSLYSKVLAGFNVGGLIGLFSTSGALSPLVLSIVASKMWDDFGRESVFQFIVSIVCVAMGFVAYSYRRLLPPSLLV